MNDTQPRIHLIEKGGYFKKINDREYESGWWAIPEEAANGLIGGLIFFHEGKKLPSFFGGTVLGFRVETEGEHKDRIVFRLESSSDCKGVKADPERWALKRKLAKVKPAAKVKTAAVESAASVAEEPIGEEMSTSGDDA